MRANPAPRVPWTWLYLAALVLLGVGIYWNALHGPFLFDDLDIKEPQTSVRTGNWFAILTGPRPLLILSYALNYELAGSRFREFDFHVVSLVLHIINAVLLWLLLRRLPGLPAAAVWGVPLLFLASPIQTESVAYISSRSELLAATFYLLALLVFAGGWRERRPWVVAALVGFCFGCSVTSKQHALTLPGAILLVDYFFFAGRDWRNLRRNWRRNWPTYAVLGALLVTGGVVVVRMVLNAPSAGFSLKDVTWQDYLFTQFRMYWLYVRLLAIPFGLNADYDIAPSRTLWQHFSWLGLAGLVALAVAVVRLRRRRPVEAFGALFFLMTLFPSSSFYPLLDYAAERRLYLPSIGLFLAAVAAASSRRLTVALAAATVICAAGTVARNRVWTDSLLLWQDTAEKSPRKWRAQANLGRELSDRRRFPEAAAAYQKAAEYMPKDSPNRAEVLSSYGSTLANQGRYAEAAEVYRKALQDAPGHQRLWTNLGIAEIRLGRPEGWEKFEKAIHLDPVAWEPHMARANLYYQMKRYDEAIRDYERVLQLFPDHPDAQYNLKAAQAMKLRIRP